MAASHGSVEVTKLLFKTEGVHPDWTDEAMGDVTPLNNAARKGHQEVMKLYLADPRVAPGRFSQSGRNALIYAAQGHHPRIVELLLRDGRVDPLASGPGVPRPLQAAASGQRDNTDVLRLLLGDLRVDVNGSDNDGITALHKATISCNPVHIRLLLDAGADINKASESGHTALHASCIRPTRFGDEVLALLLAAPSVDLNVRNREGKTVLMIVARLYHKVCGNNMASRLMNDNRLLPNIMDHTGKTALSIAALNGADGCVRQLLALDGIDVNAGAERKQFVLHLAVESGYYETVVEVMRDERIYTMCRNKHGWTPFILAAALGYTHILSLLHDTGRCISKDDVEDWKTAKNLADERNHGDTVVLLDEFLAA
ncbi:ankyrin repeat domain-containing protein [Candidatus Bathyarchaeota archaeon]|nr:ankyrin repeat domain-containing protein [Candidatus Bathyarchaeota archaeon]